MYIKELSVQSNPNREKNEPKNRNETKGQINKLTKIWKTSSNRIYRVPYKKS